MNKRMSPPKLIALAAMPLIVLGMVRPAYAGVPQFTLGAPGTSSPVHASSTHLAAPRANLTPVAGAHGPGSAPHSIAPRPDIFVGPIRTPPPFIGVWPASVDAPGTYPLQATASTVTVSWYDRSNDELGFQVSRRDLSGNWQVVYQVASNDTPGSGESYSWVDTSTNISGQCYEITAYDSTASGSTGEECTVRPDPSRFPQYVGSYAPQWSGLSDVNDGTGDLVNTMMDQDLLYGNRTWGVNLTWGDSSLWRVEAQGGPHLMKGQAVALRVWGGGWLKYGNQTFGVDLQLSSTPVYEWYAIGLQSDPSENSWAGHDLTDGGTFALWNSSAQAYLVQGHQTWGIGLAWYRVGGGSTATPSPTPTQPQGVKTERVLNCSEDQQAVEVFIADQTAGSGFVDKGTVGEQYGSAGCPAYGSVPLTFSPLSGHRYLLVATDSTLSSCDGTERPDKWRLPEDGRAVHRRRERLHARRYRRHRHPDHAVADREPHYLAKCGL